MTKTKRLGLPKNIKMHCKKCGKPFFCNLQCIPHLKEMRYFLTVNARRIDHLCLCWNCDEAGEEFKTRCEKGSPINFDKIG